jgi:hypothetical protein
MPVVLVAAVVALVAGCSWIQPSNRVLAEQGESAAPSGGTSSSTSALAAGAQPEWARALGAGVVVTAPAAAAPGDYSPAAAVQGLLNASTAGTPAQSCTWYPPSAQASCQAAVAKVPAGSGGTMRNFALGYVAVNGNEALVGTTGTSCSPDATPTCESNDDPAAVFAQAKPFPELWAESVAADLSTTNSYQLTTCVKVGDKWYVYSPIAGGNT